MKKNLPVTGREVDYPADETLISSTDLKGRVTFANEGFCRVAKFGLDELVGQSHNVVRHPDMPPAAFQNLWDEVKAGRPWVGAVKNRCKDGDHYWVDAHVTPIFRNGQVAGYESVRVKPDRALVRRAEKLYRRVWKGRVGFTRRFYHHTAVRLSLGFFVLLGAMLAVQALLPAPFGTWLAYAGAAVAGPLGIAVSLRRLKRLGAHARRIADNPVTQKVYEGDLDEMAQAEAALHMLKANQRTILRRIGASAAHLQDVAHQGRDQVQQTTQTIAQQHAEVEQVATAMNEMSATVNEVARNTSQAAEAAHAANEEAHDGKRVLDRAIHSIDALTREVDNTANALEALSQQSGQIGSIINVIREIADQTNLLALNAAIESARAGEQGEHAHGRTAAAGVAVAHVGEQRVVGAGRLAQLGHAVAQRPVQAPALGGQQAAGPRVDRDAHRHRFVQAHQLAEGRVGRQVVGQVEGRPGGRALGLEQARDRFGIEPAGRVRPLATRLEHAAGGDQAQLDVRLDDDHAAGDAHRVAGLVGGDPVLVVGQGRRG
ncbi:MAG: methyl-accepting chemotaxis protein, partial [Gammaproteobacteria bacterium]|nr:methyl-accepting chemotaxis protein [Gammaproteobacteria bacterium]MDX5375322.1 methyl-accepting chemotaxis protein [Gammaproteobacteria bacterium]